MASPSNLAVVQQQDPGTNPYNAPAYVSARALAANVAETISVPANATKVRLAGTVDFFYAMGAAGTTAVVPVDTDDGTSNELIKQQGSAEWRTCQGAAVISVITAAAGGGIVTASFYTN